jgi:hypothetical protein
MTVFLHFQSRGVEVTSWFWLREAELGVSWVGGVHFCGQVVIVCKVHQWLLDILSFPAVSLLGRDCDLNNQNGVRSLHWNVFCAQHWSSVWWWESQGLDSTVLQLVWCRFFCCGRTEGCTIPNENRLSGICSSMLGTMTNSPYTFSLWDENCRIDLSRLGAQALRQSSHRDACLCHRRSDIVPCSRSSLSMSDASWL